MSSWVTASRKSDCQTSPGTALRLGQNCTSSDCVALLALRGAEQARPEVGLLLPEHLGDPGPGGGVRHPVLSDPPLDALRVYLVVLVNAGEVTPGGRERSGVVVFRMDIGITEMSQKSFSDVCPGTRRA